jgi:Flp pilus assembly secretin CpaC
MNILTKASALVVVSTLFAGAVVAEQLSVEANTSIPVRLKGAAASVVLGNQNIADVAVHDENLIFITGKTFGTTNLMVFDKMGREVYNAQVAVSVNTNNQVTVNRSGQNFTYDCAPGCRDVLSTGDDRDYFDTLMKQHREMQALTEAN